MNVYDIKDPQFLKDLSIKELVSLSEDIRAFLIENISHTGGHLSSNLGAVELTIALHKVFDSPKDQILFDVGHQAYTHKILTGRAPLFDTLRKTDGLSGFLKRTESIHDVMEAGHSSTSLAIGAGMLYAKKYNQDIGHVIMLIGDGALANGMALEALNFMGHDASKHPIIILNDNEMSISKNVGYLSKILTKIRMKKSVKRLSKTTMKFTPKPLRGFARKLEKRMKGFISGQSYFEDQGYDYYGPLDGHDFKSLLTALTIAKQANKPCIVHVRTKKGKGYNHSEVDTLGIWHGVSPFEIESGCFIKGKKADLVSYSKAVSRYLVERAKHDPDFYVMTPAMIGGSDLHAFEEAYPDRLIDVGIAEQTAVGVATGLGLKNVKVFLSIYSTFLQRAYDQVIHDVTRQNINVIFGIDRAGLVGGDGETHQGIYDIPMLSHIPNITIVHPKNTQELYGMLEYAFNTHKGAIAIRYPREDVYVVQNGETFDEIPPSWDVITKGSKATIITFGSLVCELEHRINKESLDYTLINARYIKPLDEKVLRLIDRSKPIITVEESTLTGGLGSMIRDYFSDQTLQYNTFIRLGFHEAFVPQGDKETMLKRYGLDADSILKKVSDSIEKT
jgi:1-deoxy-D-xylulose-5-phosphate synthase